MKIMKKLLALSILMIVSVAVYAQQPPYSGTIFIDSNIIKTTDPSAIQSTTYTGQSRVIMYDRRVPGWVTVNAYLFNVVWRDGITSRAQVNPEFGSVQAATVQAEKYAYEIGKLPSCLREDVDEIWIQQGTELFGGGNRSVLIHTGQTVNYEKSGILEETLVHEASHTSLDAAHATSTGWKNAQTLDNNFISTYARDNPTSEDIAESFLLWFAVRYRQNRISVVNFNKITQTIPNRLKYFDGITCKLFPTVSTSNTFEKIQIGEFYPNPTKSSLVSLDYLSLSNSDISLTVYDVSGKIVFRQNQRVNTGNNTLNINFLFINKGMYIVKIENDNSFIHRKLILQ